MDYDLTSLISSLPDGINTRESCHDNHHKFPRTPEVMLFHDDVNYNGEVTD